MKYNVKPTDLQKATLLNLKNNPKMLLGDAMRKAGYKEESAQKPKQNFTDRKGTIVAMEEWKDELSKVGITQEFFARKYWEWINAKKIKGSFTEPDRVVPDYDTQLKAAELVRKDWGMETQINLNQINVGEDLIIIKDGNQTDQMADKSMG